MLELNRIGIRINKFILNTTANIPTPPTSKRSRRRLLAAIFIAIVVVAVVVGAYALMSGPSAGSNSTSPSPSTSTSPSSGTSATPSSGATSTPSSGATSTPSSGATSTPSASATTTPQANQVGTASSLQFSVDITTSGSLQGTYTYMVKNAETENLMLRIEMKDPNGTTTFTYVVNGVQQKAWMYDGTTWTDLSAAYSSTWSTWSSSFAGYRDTLLGWNGLADWIYTSPNGDSVRYYNIAVNPALPDSLFQPS